jgi:hypothetical protein
MARQKHASLLAVPAERRTPRMGRGYMRTARDNFQHSGRESCTSDDEPQSCRAFRSTSSTRWRSTASMSRTRGANFDRAAGIDVPACPAPLSVAISVGRRVASDSISLANLRADSQRGTDCTTPRSLQCASKSERTGWLSASNHHTRSATCDLGRA